jgi:hypothetical protein
VQSRQKSYADKHCHKFDDLVYRKVYPMRCVMRFGKNGKLSLRYVGSFQVKKHLSPATYKVELLPSLDEVHDVFHVSQLLKCVHDPLHIINYKPLHIQANLTYEEHSVQIVKIKN